jgi:hypothetical protein
MAAEATRILWLTTIGAEFDRRARPPAKPEATQEEIVHGA